MLYKFVMKSIIPFTYAQYAIFNGREKGVDFSGQYIRVCYTCDVSLYVGSQKKMRATAQRRF